MPPHVAEQDTAPVTLVETRDLRLDYGELTAVNNLNMQIQAGEIYGLVGPNGAGKTSLLKMMANLIRPTYGELFICGIDLAENPRDVYQQLGYMPDLSPVAPELKVWEFLEFFAAAYGIDSGQRKAVVDRALEQVQMAEHRNAYGKSLSRGMTQRVVLAKTLIPNPRVLLLDEPASGMDPIARINLKNILVELGEQGVTTVISSHILTELADMCTSVGIMNHGKLLKSGPIDSVLQDRPVSRLAISALGDQHKLMDLLRSRELVLRVGQNENKLVVDFSGTLEQEADLLRTLVLDGASITSFSRLSATMEDTLIELVNPGPELEEVSALIAQEAKATNDEEHTND